MADLDTRAGRSEVDPSRRDPGLEAMFSPKSIAIIGASERPDTLSGRPLLILQQHKYQGRIYPVNPRHQTLAGLQTYPSVADVPETVDLAVIAVRAELVPGMLRRCADAGVRSAVVFSSGFAEEGGHGTEAQRELAELARCSGMRILGPNAEGYFNLGEGIPVSFSPTVDYERGLTRLVPGNVAVVSQSGGLGFAIFNWGQSVGLGASTVVSTGNEADVDALDVAAYLLEDPGTEVIALLVEGFHDPARLRAVARRARELGKHLVVAKLGSSEAGRRAAMAHTAHDVGDDTAYQELFDAEGVIRVQDQEELLDVCFALSRPQRPAGNRVGIVTASGGSGVWLADALTALGLQVPELDAPLQAKLRGLMPSYGSPANPVDTTAQVVARAGIAEVLGLLCDSDQVDTVVLIASLASPHMLEREEAQIKAVLASTTKPVLIYSYTRPGEASIEAISRVGVAWYPSPGRVARVVRALVDAESQ